MSPEDGYTSTSYITSLSYIHHTLHTPHTPNTIHDTPYTPFPSSYLEHLSLTDRQLSLLSVADLDFLQCVSLHGLAVFQFVHDACAPYTQHTDLLEGSQLRVSGGRVGVKLDECIRPYPSCDLHISIPIAIPKYS
ncbi:hypothetical protein EON63_24775 [archaeon]|nr:MAG: hypothetical protein EON63_24775 [archaeon]